MNAFCKTVVTTVMAVPGTGHGLPLTVYSYCSASAGLVMAALKA